MPPRPPPKPSPARSPPLKPSRSPPPPSTSPPQPRKIVRIPRGTPLRRTPLPNPSSWHPPTVPGGWKRRKPDSLPEDGEIPDPTPPHSPQRDPEPEEEEEGMEFVRVLEASGRLVEATTVWIGDAIKAGIADVEAVGRHVSVIGEIAGEIEEELRKLRESSGGID